MNPQNIKEHEKNELYDLLNFKNICAVKAGFLQEMCSDQQLKELLNENASTSKQHIQELQNLLSGSSNMNILQ